MLLGLRIDVLLGWGQDGGLLPLLAHERVQDKLYLGC